MLIRTPDEITSAWLAKVLDRDGLTVDTVEPIGLGQMSQSHRVAFTAPGGEASSVVVKLASDDPSSRAAGVGMGGYLREVRFYQELAAATDGTVPASHLSVYEPTEGWFTLVLEDIADGVVGEQLAGCTVDEARRAMLALARLHAPHLGDLRLSMTDWLNQPMPLNQALFSQLLAGFLERFGDHVGPEHATVCERFAASLDAWWTDARPPLGVVHGDYRLDNLLFTPGGCRAVDWQTVRWGPVMIDVAYFLGNGLLAEGRRAHEQDLVRVYHDELLRLGATTASWERCWEEYRRCSFYGLLIGVTAAMIVQRTDRGDEMLSTSVIRAAEQIIDLDAVSLLPAPSTGRPPALQPDPNDEGCHEPGAQRLWNESWYFDGVSDDGTLGVYVRLGRLPNQEITHYAACVCGPGRDTVMLVDPAAPLPAADDDAQVIDGDDLHAEHRCLKPLQRYRVTARGASRAFADASGPLRDEPGEPVDVELDLTWETDGAPYAWRQTTRYEIPCRVTGTIRIGDEQLAFSGPGQRDHSWGPRDWWAQDWMWSALHLEDGTHTHAAGMPAMPGVGVGYVQRDSAVSELDSVTATEDFSEAGLVTSARIISGPDPLDLEIEPLAFGPLRLVSPDGRVCRFPRAMCRVTAADGRTGVGWVEWGRNDR